MAWSYRGQAQQRPRQFLVISCSENQTRGVAILGVEGESDVLTGVIWVDKDKEFRDNVKEKDQNTGITLHERVAGLHNR